MVTREEIFEAAKQSILKRNPSMAKKIAEQGLAEGIDPVHLLNEGFIPGISEIGELFSMGRIFLPELIQAGDVMQQAMATVSTAFKSSDEQSNQGRILIGTVRGDYHDIGKSIVVALFKANGFNVLDLGRDVPVERFMEEAERFHPHVIGTSALLTTTMDGQRELEKELRKAGLREKYKTIVGGAPVTQRWADRIGADAYAEDAVDGIKKVKRLLGLG